MRILSDSDAGLARFILLYFDWLAKQLMVDTSDGAVSKFFQSSTLQRRWSRAWVESEGDIFEELQVNKSKQGEVADGSPSAPFAGGSW